MTSDELTSEDCIITWLHPVAPLLSPKGFEHQRIIEQREMREIVFQRLARVVFLYHNDPALFRSDLEALDFPGLAQALDQRPTSQKVRMGNFGEILASEYLRIVRGYEIPIFRLRYNPNRETSMHGDDVIAFKFGEPDGSSREIVVGESKARQQFTSEAVKNGYEQLIASSRRPHPVSLAFIYQVLAGAGQIEKAAAVREYLNSFAPHPPRKRWLLFVVTGSQHPDPFGTLDTISDPLENLIAVDVSIEGLNDWVTRLFEQEVTAYAIND